MRLSARRLQVAEHFREILPRVLEILLELGSSPVRLISQRLPRLRELGFACLELRAGRVDLPLRLFHVTIRRVELDLQRREGLLARREFPVSAVDGLDEGLDLLLPLAKGRLLRVEDRALLLRLLHRGLGVRRRGLVLPQVLEFLAGFLQLALEVLERFLRLSFG